MWKRGVWLTAGLLAMALGLVGIFLPVLPTTPFILLAAFCFARSSPKFEAWLLNHPRWGPSVRAWREYRAVPLRAKILATAMMAISCVVAALLIEGWLGLLPAFFCAGVAAWLWRLPHGGAVD